MGFVPLEQEKDEQLQTRGFIPLDSEGASEPRGFVPLEDAVPERPSVLKTIALENPATAIGETALNLVTQGVALPLAGLAGIGTIAAKAVGLTEKDPADVVHAVGDRLTYQPRGEFGKAATGAVMAPFEMLHEGALSVGGKTLDATGSPAAATAAHTFIEGVLPLAVGPAAKGAKAAREKFSTRSATHADQAATQLEARAGTEAIAEAASQPEAAARGQGGHEGNAPAPRGFIPLSEAAADAQRIVETPGRVVADPHAMQQPEAGRLDPLRRAGNQDGARVGTELSAVSDGRWNAAESGSLARSTGRDQELRAGQRGVDDAAPADAPAPVLPEGAIERSAGDYRGSIEGIGDRGLQAAAADAGLRQDVARSGDARQVGAAGRDIADASGRDAAAGAVGEARRASSASRVEAPENRMAARAGVEQGAVPGPKTARYALIEADNLKASHDVDMRPVSANPFGRQNATRHEQEMAIQGITKDFDPARLTDAIDDADGAPIAAADGVVEAGQRRAVAIKRVYQANGAKADAYRQHLRDNADRFGLAPEQIDGMRKPVLVRLPDEPAPRMPAVEQGATLPSAPVRAQVGEAMPPDLLAKVSPEGDGTPQAMAAGVQNSWAPGANYVPLRDAMPAAAGRMPTTKATKPIRREDVLRPLLEALDIKPYWGRVRGKRLGYYLPKKEALRVKNKSDLEVTAHELGHLLDDRVPAIRAAWRNDIELRAELKAISYDKASVSEGYAESVRLWLSNPEALEAAAPKAYGWLETFADTHPYGPALRKAQSGAVAWFEQSALDRGRSKIGDPTSLKNRPLLDFLGDQWKGFRKSFRQTVVDDLDGIRLAEMGLTGKLSPLGAYEVARLTRAAGSITDGAIRWGHPVKRGDASFTYSGKGLEEVLRPVAGKLDDFITYAVGRSARELQQQGREHLLTPVEVRAMTGLETPEFRTAFAELQTWQKGVADFAESLGLLNPETRALWRRADYVPFWRVEQGISGRGEVSGAWSGIKTLKGGTGNLREPLQNIIQNANMLIGAALKNDARLRVVEMIEKEQGGGRFMQKIPAESRPVKVDAKQVQEAVLKGLGIDDRASLPPEGAKFAAHIEKQIAEAPEFYQFFAGGQAPKGGNIVAVMKAGKPEYYEVADPLLLRALTAIDRPAQSWIIKLLGWPKRIGQASIVLDPSFAAANFSRDQLMAGIMTKSGFRPLIDAMDGMRRRVTSDPLYREWVANGGGMSSLFLDESAFRAKLEQFYTRQGIDYRTVIDSPKKLLSMIETFGDAFESATRIGSMKRSLEKGDHPRHAAYEAREVSVDFSLAGDAPAVRALFDTVVFLRATVVSWDRLYRGVVHDQNRGAIAAKTAMLGLGSAALYLMNRGDPRYDDMPDYLKDSHFHVFIGDKHFMIPRPFEPGAIGRIAEVAVEKVMSADPDGLGKDLARIISNTFHLNLMPQIAAPLVEQYANKNSFTGAPIETPDHAGVEPFLRSKPGTSETFKALGMATRDLPETMQVNPVRAEALLRGYLNSWAAYGLMASDRLVVGKNLPEMRADEMPVARRFYREEPAKHTRFESEFYEMLASAKRLRGTMRELDEMNLRGLADEKEQSPLAGEAKPLERAAKNLSAINNEMQAVRRDDALTPAEKRQRLDGLTVERNALMKAAVTESKAAQRAKTTPVDVVRRGLPKDQFEGETP